MALESTQPLTEMSIRNLPGGKGRPAPVADYLTAICKPIVLENVGASTFHNPVGLHSLLQLQLYLFSFSPFVVCLHLLFFLSFLSRRSTKK
jgi:hypothetical protein